MAASIRTALVLFALLTLVTGLAYPLLVTGIAAVAFPHEAHGSLIEEGGQVRGSELIGQPFTKPGYFWSRPSATTPAYNGAASNASNLGPTSSALAEAIKARVEALRAANPGNTPKIPVDLVTTSGSGLDPHISIAAARFQTGRVARTRRMSEASVNELVDEHTGGRFLGLFGEPVVNVLELNLALDRRSQGNAAQHGVPRAGT